MCGCVRLYVCVCVRARVRALQTSIDDGQHNSDTPLLQAELPPVQQPTHSIAEQPDHPPTSDDATTAAPPRPPSSRHAPPPPPPSSAAEGSHSQEQHAALQKQASDEEAEQGVGAKIARTEGMGDIPQTKTQSQYQTQTQTKTPTTAGHMDGEVPGGEGSGSKVGESDGGEDLTAHALIDMLRKKVVCSHTHMHMHTHTHMHTHAHARAHVHAHAHTSTHKHAQAHTYTLANDTTTISSSLSATTDPPRPLPPPLLNCSAALCWNLYKIERTAGRGAAETRGGGVQ